MSKDPAAGHLWLVERTYSDDEQNLIILTYATTDGEYYNRKERAVTVADEFAPTAAIDVERKNLGQVTDPEVQDRYATEARRMAATHDPDDEI